MHQYPCQRVTAGGEGLRGVNATTIKSLVEDRTRNRLPKRTNLEPDTEGHFGDSAVCLTVLMP